MSLTELERANGGPFKLLDFEGELGGYVTDWLGGKLDKLSGGCGLGAEFSMDAFNSAQWKASGGLLSFGNAALRAAKPKLSEIIVAFPVKGDSDAR
jgi:hypothetical protein